MSAEPLAQDWGEIARIYDLETPACRGPELAFWRRQAAAVGDTALELAAGTGRVAIALARKGVRMTGLELSEAMLDRARGRTARLPPAVQERLTWVQGDMADFRLPNQAFGLVFVAFNSFWLLPSPDAQARCLRCAAQHLAPEGRLVLDLFPPNDDDHRDEVGLAIHLPAQHKGRGLLRLKDYRYDPERRLAISDVRYYAEDRLSDAVKGLVATFRYTLRLAAPEEVRALLEDEGYKVESVFGSYGEAPLAPYSPRAIFVCRRRE
jgi:SAM-dependent methyltransferase